MGVRNSSATSASANLSALFIIRRGAAAASGASIGDGTAGWMVRVVAFAPLETLLRAAGDLPAALRRAGVARVEAWVCARVP